MTPIASPDSVLIVATRNQFIAGAQSVESTRLGICTPVKVMSGTVVVPPTRPAWVMRCSHSPALVASPGSGNEWVKVHDSTSRYVVPEPVHTRVRTDARRLVVQKLGLPIRQEESTHCWSHGVSGQCAASCVVQPDRHRSAVVTSTCIGAVPYAVVLRVP